MSTITLKGNPVQTSGTLPKPGSSAPNFRLVKTDMTEVTLADFKGKRIVLNISPSIDTGVCAASVRKFNEEAHNLKNTVVLYVSRDLPYAHKRFCSAEGLEEVIPVSAFRSPDFGKMYGVTMDSGAMAGLFSRAVVVLDEAGRVIYTEQVPEITQEPDYDRALEALK